MTKAQRSRYWGTLWPAACEVHGWSTKNELQRRKVTLEATGQASTSGLSESQITALFNALEWLADPANLDKAMPVANPEIGEENHRRRQLVWRINKSAARAGLRAEWIQETAQGKCHAHRVGQWQELPLPELLKLSFTVESRTSDPAQIRRDQRRIETVQDACRPPAEAQSELPF